MQEGAVIIIAKMNARFMVVSYSFQILQAADADEGRRPTHPPQSQGPPKNAFLLELRPGETSHPRELRSGLRVHSTRRRYFRFVRAERLLSEFASWRRPAGDELSR